MFIAFYSYFGSITFIPTTGFIQSMCICVCILVLLQIKIYFCKALLQEMHLCYFHFILAYFFYLNFFSLLALFSYSSLMSYPKCVYYNITLPILPVCCRRCGELQYL